ncbi:hypothetical protein EB796_021387 [Bugula neritina]|uniref:C-type lectin domain-containing protein n=1 Tax=Bugula neritina TaxID=10212 RepID=A0A7J7J2A8_BUGNE|nr:hypothetical protein EB796_021387 [Bugula neritina]
MEITRVLVLAMLAKLGSTECSGSFPHSVDDQICYYVPNISSSKISRVAAEDACRSMGGQLAKIHNLINFDILFDFIGVVFREGYIKEFHMGLEKQNGVISWSLDKEIMPDLLISEFVDNSHTVYENCTFYLSTG